MRAFTGFQGFRDFVLRGNLVELSVAFVMGAAFTAVVTAMTKVIIELVAKVGGSPNFDAWQPGGLTTVGPFLTALVAFLLMALVVYLFVVKPYQLAKARYFPPEPVEQQVDESVELLRQIRDALQRQTEGR
jgi:large conductance mechanosensitive channel